ncbi:hypothetical protein NIES3275_03130 [Microchaete diplosiphon NIES-3275]|nr:hypothetical protein NIES3275_03130 [Microchaete diplosiphon NIES-3275]
MLEYYGQPLIFSLYSGVYTRQALCLTTQVFCQKHLLWSQPSRGHLCQLNVKPALVQGFALTPSPSPTG